MRTGGTAKEAEERAQFLLRLRARGIGDLPLLRAMELTPRSLFLPQRFADIAARDIALPIGCGQTSTPPSTLALMIDALRVKEGGTILEVGTGSGYATALMSQMGARVLTLERCQTLALEARSRLAAFGLSGVEVRFADGLAVSRIGSFERILVNGVIEPPLDGLTRLLAPGGVLVAGIAGDAAGEQRILRLFRPVKGEIEAHTLGTIRTLTALAPGLARAL
jgi:protein-L-isoaspartate(D-aspartate) O-methyltransferase